MGPTSDSTLTISLVNQNEPNLDRILNQDIGPRVLGKFIEDKH